MRNQIWRGVVPGICPLLLLVCFPAGGALPAATAGTDWPQWRGQKRDGVWKEQGLIRKFAGPQIKIRWRAPVSQGYSGPTVAAGRVYVTDRVVEPKSQERVHCFAWETGRLLWSHAYDCDYRGVSSPDGPRASVTVAGSNAYSLGSVGHLYCFDAASGKVRWNRDLQKEYGIRLPDWGIAAAPVIEGELLVVFISGKDGASLVALDKETGIERWRALNDRATYSAPVVIDQAGKRVLVCWTADRLVGLDPKTGKLFWEYPFPSRQTVDAVATPVVAGDRLFVSSVYEGSLMLRLRQDRLAVERIWPPEEQQSNSDEGLHAMMATPLLVGGYVYGIDYHGQLRCLDARTGKRLWENTTVVPRANWATAHCVQNGDRIWIFNERGQLIIARFSPEGYEEFSRAQLLKPTLGQLPQRGGVCWSHPAYAYQHVFVRNDEELVCASLKEERPEARQGRSGPFAVAGGRDSIGRLSD